MSVLKEKNFSVNSENLGGFLLFFYSFTLPFDFHLYANIYIRILYLLGALLFCLGGMRISINKGKIEYLDILVPILLSFIIFNSGDIRVGLYTNVMVYILIFSFYLVIRRKYKWWDGFIAIAKIMTFAYALITILTYFSRPFFENVVLKILNIYRELLLAQYNSGWMPGATNHYSVNAMYITLGIFIYLPKLLKREQICAGEKRGIYLRLVIYFIALFMTGKRAHILFTIIAFFITYYYSTVDRPRFRVTKIILFATIVFIVIVLLANVIPFVATFIERFKYQVAIGDITSGRGILLKYALKEFNSNKWFGIGWNEFQNVYHANYSVTGEILNVHNVYVQLLTEVGILGFFAFVFFFLGNYVKTVSYLISCRKMRIQDNEEILLCSVFLQTFFLIYCITGNPLYDMNIFFPYIAVCAITRSIRLNHIYYEDQSNEN